MSRSLCFNTNQQQVCLTVTPLTGDVLQTQLNLTDVGNLARRLVCPNTSKPSFPGENHFPCMNFIGPGTQVQQRLERGDQPVNAADRCALIHDLEYEAIARNRNQISQADFDRVVRESDDKLLQCLQETTDRNLLGRIAPYIASSFIQGKERLENLGLLGRSYFI